MAAPASMAAAAACSHSALAAFAKNSAGLVPLARCFSTTSRLNSESYKLLIVGGGSGGLAMANKMASKLGDKKVAVIEPSHLHYYQPYFTLVGGGVKQLSIGGSHKEVGDILTKKAVWIHDSAESFDPDSNTVVTHQGKKVKYDFMVVSMGIQTNYKAVKGLLDALEHCPQVCSNYHPKYVGKTFKAIQNFKEGNAIFTFPNTPVKCAGAPQKIMYLTDWRLRQMGKRDKAKLIYNTSLGVIFGVPTYAAPLLKIVKERDLTLNLRHNLIEVKPDKREAVFELLDNPGQTVTFPYEMLHVCPPQSSPDVLKASKLADPVSGFLNVDKQSLQHVQYKNVFGIGDCTNVPTAKTAAAVASQSGLLKKNLVRAMQGQEPLKEYDGYTSCPLVIGYDKCILAEFDFNGNPLETFPVDQSIPRTSMYHLKAQMMPVIYWEGLVKGYWEGPKFFRKAMNTLGLK